MSDRIPEQLVGTMLGPGHAAFKEGADMANDEIDETTRQSLEQARINAGIPVTSGDLAGTSGDDDYVDETVAERGTTDTEVHTDDKPAKKASRSTKKSST